MGKFSELKAAALAATPGPWESLYDDWSDGDDALISSESRDGMVAIAKIEGGGEESGYDEPFSSEQQANAVFIATANPAAILAMLAELEAKDDALRAIAFHVSAGGYNADSVDAEVFKKKIIDGINSISDVQIKRIAELEAIRSDASQVFKEIGNELGCNPDNESIMMAIDDLKANQMTGPLKDVLRRNIELEKRLATPVRLPCPACTYADHSYPAYSRKQVEVILTSAGMRFTVEGDE